MKFKLIILLLLINCIVFTQSDRKIKIIVLSDSVPADSSVYVTGNHQEIGSWQTVGLAMNKNGMNEWSCQLILPEKFHLEYKLTLGSWEYEALDWNGYVPSNNILEVENDTTIILTVLSWGNNPKQKFEGQITGTVEYYYNLNGKGIKPRDVIVWLPPGYYESEEHYPVLYMHDGQNVFDPATSTFGVDWQIDEAADTLIGKNYIRPIIIVAIYNTPDRSKEYSDNDTGYAYMDFLVNNLKPMIDSTYRTKPGRENTVTGGSSLGGLISFMIPWHHPDIFSMAICISPAFKIKQYDFVTPVISYEGEKKNIKIYMDVGNVGLEDSLRTGINEMVSALETKGYKEGEDFYRYIADNAEHSEKFWADRIWRPLIFMFGNENYRKLFQQ